MTPCIVSYSGKGDARIMTLKVGNDYQRTVSKLADECPKAVFAAIAVSFASRGGDDLTRAQRAICYEWQVLFDNQIVPQKPPQWVKNLAVQHSQMEDVEL